MSGSLQHIMQLPHALPGATSGDAAGFISGDPPAECQARRRSGDGNDLLAVIPKQNLNADWSGGRADGHSTTTIVPSCTRLYRSIASSLVTRMQPEEIACPMYSGWLVP